VAAIETKSSASTPVLPPTETTVFPISTTKTQVSLSPPAASTVTTSLSSSSSNKPSYSTFDSSQSSIKETNIIAPLSIESSHLSRVNVDVSINKEDSASKRSYEEIRTTKEEISAKRLGLSHPIKTIGFVASYCLIFNNTVGPGMMGLPHLFHEAGIVPTILCIIAACIFSSLSACLFSDALASVPGNNNFDKALNFSTAFKFIMGRRWSLVAATLFIVACAVQVFASLIETAQSIDGFLASYAVGKTFAVELVPYPRYIEWKPSLCHSSGDFTDDESSLEDCTPFHNAGYLIISAGFILTTIITLPFGLGHLQETVLLQYFSFICLFLLLSQFLYEFWLRGFNISYIPLFGPDPSQVLGVVMFNFAYLITVPSWLIEKKENVNVNKIIWRSSIACATIYIVFGLLCALAFEHAGTNALIILSSSKSHPLTRLCSVLFGATIIGAGVPVLCVIIKTTLYDSKALGPNMSFFFGAIFPFLTSWILYQGEFLISILNWTGLVVNGLVCFILPLIFVRVTMNRIAAQENGDTDENHYHSNEDIESPSLSTRLSGYSKLVTFPKLTKNPLQPLPLWLEKYKHYIVNLMIFLFSSVILFTIATDLYNNINPADDLDP